MPGVGVGARVGRRRGLRLVPPPPPPILIEALELAFVDLREGMAPGALVAGLSARTTGSELRLANDAGGRIALAGTTLVIGLTPISAAATPTLEIVVLETLVGAAGSPRANSFTLPVSPIATDVLLAQDIELAPRPMAHLAGGLLATLSEIRGAATAGGVFTLLNPAAAAGGVLGTFA